MLNSIILTTLKEGSKKRNSKINPLNVAASTSSEQTQQNLTDTEIVNLNERQSNRTTIRIKKKRRTIIGGAIGGVDIEEDDIEDIEDEEEEEEEEEIDEVIKKQDSSSLNNDDTDRDEDLELVQDEDDEAKNEEIIENVVEEASVSDLVVENEPEKKGEESSYKLFKIILEQTDPVVWDNQENNNNIVNSSQVDDQVKLTISSQIPIALNTNPNENKSKQSNLTVCQSDFWSNTAVVVEEEAAKMSSTDSEDLIKLSTDSEKSSDVVDVLNPSSQPGKKKNLSLFGFYIKIETLLDKFKTYKS